MQLLIGTDTQADSQGIYQCEFNGVDASFSSAACVIETISPTWFTFNDDGSKIFSICEESSAARVESYQRNLSTGDISPINRVSLPAKNPCHAVYAQNALIVSCYVSGSLASLAVNAKGELQTPASLINQVNEPFISGQSRERQEAPHIHSATFSLCGSKVWSLDLGNDQILQFDFNPADATLQADKTYQVAAGSGPRHMALHPNGRWVYIAMELSLEVVLFEWNESELVNKQVVKCRRADFAQEAILSEIQLHPNGRFCYVAIRGSNDIACFAIDPNDGSLSLLALTPCGGNWPRHFTFTADGRWLLVANQLSHNVSVFSVDSDTGVLQASCQHLKVNSPMCVKFIPSEFA